MGDFATAAQLASFLQQDLDTTSADLAITMAEGLVRAYCRQNITEATSTGAVLPIQVTDFGYIVRLSERPVSAVSAVSVNGTAYVSGTDYAWDGVSDWLRLATVEWSSDSFEAFPPAVVTYTYGYATVPAAVQAVTLSVAGRLYDNPRGMRSESVEGYTYQRGGAGDDILSAGLSEAEKASLAKFVRRASTVMVG